MEFLKSIEELRAQREKIRSEAVLKQKQLEDAIAKAEKDVEKLKTKYFVNPTEQNEKAANTAIKTLNELKAELEIKKELTKELEKEYLSGWTQKEFMEDVDKEYKSTCLDEKIEKYKKLYEEIGQLKVEIEEGWDNFNQSMYPAAFNICRMYISNSDRELCLSALRSYLNEVFERVYSLEGIKNIPFPISGLHRSSLFQNSIDE